MANQHLPVFDWHYLFGYATLLLLAVHLAFNWRAVWHHLAGATAAESSLAVVERFHEFSAHSRGGVLRRAPGVDWGDPPPPFKAYPGRPRIALPQPLPQDAAPGAVDLRALSSLLWHGAAVNLRRGTIAFRTAPSSGALFASELYVVARAVAGLAPGHWHYDGQAHALQRLADATPLLDERAGADAAAPALLVATAIFRRSGHKYRDRA